MTTPKRSVSLMLIPAIIGYGSVVLDGILNQHLAQQRALALVLLVVFGVIFFLPIPHRGHRRINHVRTGLETVVVCGLLILQPGWSVYPILFFLMGPQVMTCFDQRTGLAWVGVFTLATAVIFIALQGIPGLLVLFPYIAGYLFFAAFGWMRTQAENDRLRSEKLLIELQEAHAKLKEYATRVEELAIVQERNRIAREVHDSLGHRLTVASVQLEGAQRLARSNPERAEKIIGTVRDQVREGLAELRRTVAILRASVEEDLPLPEALTRLASQFEEATGLTIHIDLEGCPGNLPITYRQSFYRAVQEGLTNIQRHARANEAWITINLRDGQITLLISDNGAGIPVSLDQAPEIHFGLVGLKEKAALLGGEFFIDPRPGGGTQLTFRLPVLTEEPHE
jgi:signal transduction histidine kinase